MGLIGAPLPYISTYIYKYTAGRRIHSSKYTSSSTCAYGTIALHIYMYIWHPLSPQELIWLLTRAAWIDALSSYDVSALFLFLSPSHEMTIVVVVTLMLMADGAVAWGGDDDVDDEVGDDGDDDDYDDCCDYDYGDDGTATRDVRCAYTCKLIRCLCKHSLARGARAACWINYRCVRNKWCTVRNQLAQGTTYLVHTYCYPASCSAHHV
jgi:hypothetical protein